MDLGTVAAPSSAFIHRRRANGVISPSISFSTNDLCWFGSNFDEHEPRKGLIVSFVVADVLFSPSLGGIYSKQQDSYRAMHQALKELAPGREHIIPTGEEGHDWPTAPSHTHNGAWAASDVVEKWWTELFLPGETLRHAMS